MSRHLNCSCHDPSGENTGRGLRCKKLPASKDLGISETVATKLAIDALENYKVPRLEELPVCRLHGPDVTNIPYRLFGMLDKDLFRGVLKDQVYLRWTVLPEDVHGVTSRPGARDTRITIELNKLLPCQRQIPPAVILAVLIHHMAHAYFLICCGFRDEPSQSEKHNLGHGLAYSTLVHKITEIFRPGEIRKFPNLFHCYPGYYVPSQQPHRLYKSRTRRMVGSSHCSCLAKDFPSKETCRDHVLTLRELKPLERKKDEKSKIVDPYPKTHYLHTVKPEKSEFIPILRTRYPSPSTDYVELHYANYAVPFPRSKLKTSSIASKFSDGNSILNIPAPSQPTFFAFYSYLLNGDYPPELVQISPYITATAANGPPFISTYLPDAPNYVATDIQMFKLASKLGFPELRSKALERIYSLSETHADPVVVLEEIYNENSVKNEEDKNVLRKLAREFLSKTHRGQDITNIAILQQSEQWRARFSSLRQKNGLLNSDCDAVLENLVLKRALLRIEGGKKDASGSNSKKENKDGSETHSKHSEPLCLDLAFSRPGSHSRPSLPNTSSTIATQPKLAATAKSTPLSDLELEFLRQRHPSILMLYEKEIAAEKKKEAEKKAANKDKPAKEGEKSKESDNSKEKGNGNKKEVNGGSGSASASIQACSHHQCHYCRQGELVTTGDDPCWHGRHPPYYFNGNAPLVYPQSQNTYDPGNVQYFPYAYSHAGRN